VNYAGPPRDLWLDQEAGPVIRPYAFVGGRTRPAGQSFDLIAMVRATRRASVDPEALEPGHLQVLAWCRAPRSVADLATELALPLGVLRVILADLREHGLVVIFNPAAPGRRVDSHILRRVADGLRRL
jgi:hypothetical protein